MSAQSMANLAKADIVRAGRAVIKRDLAALPFDESRAAAMDILRNPPTVCESMAIVDLLRATSRTKTLRAMKICARARVGEGRRLAELTDREVESLCDAMSRRV